MAWRPEHLVRVGELDNTHCGWTVGWLDLDGFSERLNLKLVGNCHPDLAGWKFRINRIMPPLKKDFDGDERQWHEMICCDQSGHTGDITADQMVKHSDVPDDEVASRLFAGEQLDFTWRKCLYLEWYSNQNGRVVIQSTRLEVERIGERAFELSEKQWQEQRQQNQHEMNFFLIQLEEALKQRRSENEDH